MSDLEKANSRSCLNCGHDLASSDKYCPTCGQEVRPAKIPIKQLFIDLMGDMFTWDNKFFRSLIPLLIKPGFLTKEYVEGRRNRYIPPLRIYVFISLIYFFVIATFTVTETNNWELSFSDREEADVLLDSGLTAEQTIDSLDVTSNFEKKVIYKMEEVKERGTLSFFESMVNNASLWVLLMVPLMALFLKLIYWRRKHYYYEHLIFCFHFQAFLFLVLSVILPIPFDAGWVGIVAFILIIYYLYRALKVVYGQPAGKTLIKLFLTIISYGIISMIVFLMNMIYTFYMF